MANAHTSGRLKIETPNTSASGGSLGSATATGGGGGGDGGVIKPDDIPLFLDWFCAPEQKAVFEEFKSRVIREIKPVLRKTEKIHERNTQRKIKHIRGEMERVLKDQLAVDKLVREGKEKMKKTSDRSISSFNQDTKTCMDNVASNLDTGRSELKKALQVFLFAILVLLLLTSNNILNLYIFCFVYD